MCNEFLLLLLSQELVLPLGASVINYHLSTSYYWPRDRFYLHVVYIGAKLLKQSFAVGNRVLWRVKWKKKDRKSSIELCVVFFKRKY